MNRTLWPLAAVLCWILATGSLAGCGWGEAEEVENAQGTVEETAEEAPADYEIFLGNAVADTLRGRATFGFVLDSETEREAFVIELATGFDFAGGLFIAHAGEELPAPGTHQLAAVPDSLRPIQLDGYSMVYRQGMLRDLSSQAGTVTFETVTDTLITGRLDATLRGFVATGTQRLSEAEIHAYGRFEARRGNPGYIVGL